MADSSRPPGFFHGSGIIAGGCKSVIDRHVQAKRRGCFGPKPLRRYEGWNHLHHFDSLEISRAAWPKVSLRSHALGLLRAGNFPFASMVVLPYF